MLEIGSEQAAATIASRMEISVTDLASSQFARDWIEAWNSHDLDRVLAHYGEDFEMRSPFIAAFAGEPTGCLRGKPAVRRYWETALERVPDLRFELLEVFSGVHSLVIRYRGHNGPVAEVFRFDPSGKVISASAHYAE